MGNLIKRINESRQGSMSSKVPEINRWDPREKRKCGSEGLCDGIWAMLIDSSTEPAGTITAVGDAKSGNEVEPTAIGFRPSCGAAKGRLLLFNCCPSCGEPLPLAENKAWPVLAGQH